MCLFAWTYDFTVEEVLFDHDNVDSLGVLEGEEPEASGATGVTITHHGALDNLSELRKVIAERLCCCQQWFGEAYGYRLGIPSVVSQFRPPINILLHSG